MGGDSMIRTRLAACAATAIALLLLAGCETGTPDQVRAERQQELVDRATLAAQDLVNPVTGKTAQGVLQKARAVVICPRLFRAGFLIGGQGGGCVLVARGGGGSWSAPAFYTLGSGSFGFQAGVQDAELIMMIMTSHGLDSVLDSQFTIGAGASVALVTLGGGVQGATGLAAGADIIAFEKTRGFFAGISLEGTSLTTDSIGDRAYYGQDVGARSIVLAMGVNNPGADPLRAVLMRYGNPATGSAPAIAPAAAPAAVPAPGAYAVPDPYAPPAGRGPVLQQSLPPPR